MIDLWLWPVIGGTLLGGMFFGGLLLTIVYGFKSPRPELWFLMSLIVRMSLTISGFILISAGRWERLLACLLGFLLARTIVFYKFPTLINLNKPVQKETRNASQQ